MKARFWTDLTGQAPAGTWPGQLTELLRFAIDGDTVIVHSMDRLARSLDDLRALVQGLTCKGGGVH